MPIAIRGAQARIEHAYQTVATVRAYSVSCLSPNWRDLHAEWSLTASVDASDPFQLRFRRPLVFVARNRHASWEWVVKEFNIDGYGILRAKLLGPPVGVK